MNSHGNGRDLLSFRNGIINGWQFIFQRLLFAQEKAGAMQEVLIEETQPKSKPALSRFAITLWCVLAIAGHLLITHYSADDELRNLRRLHPRAISLR